MHMEMTELEPTCSAESDEGVRMAPYQARVALEGEAGQQLFHEVEAGDGVEVPVEPMKKRQFKLLRKKK